MVSKDISGTGHLGASASFVLVMMEGHFVQLVTKKTGAQR